LQVKIMKALLVSMLMLTSLAPVRAAEPPRLAMFDFEMLDIAPVNAAAHQNNLQACGGCDVKLAQQIGADLEITVFLPDAHNGRLVAVASADMRGNTDESWSRATHYLVRERLLAPNYGAPPAK
jgi:hypothetical protein